MGRCISNVRELVDREKQDRKWGEYSRQRKHTQGIEENFRVKLSRKAGRVCLPETSSPRLGFSFAKTRFHPFNSSITRTLRNTIRRRMRGDENAYLTRPRNLSRCKIEQSSDDVIPRPRFTLPLPSMGNRGRETKFPNSTKTFSFLASSLLSRETSFPRVSHFESKLDRIRIGIQIVLLIIFFQYSSLF